ncbi:MAG: hypothetical protein AAGC95_09050 [Pseudomonadota bacterium]
MFAGDERPESASGGVAIIKLVKRILPWATFAFTALYGVNLMNAPVPEIGSGSVFAEHVSLLNGQYLWPISIVYFVCWAAFFLAFAWSDFTESRYARAIGGAFMGVFWPISMMNTQIMTGAAPTPPGFEYFQTFHQWIMALAAVPFIAGFWFEMWIDSRVEVRKKAET